MCDTANCPTTNGFWTCGRHPGSCCAVEVAGGQAGCACSRPGWCRWRSAVWPPSSTSSRRSTSSCASPCSPSSSPTRTSRSDRRTRGSRPCCRIRWSRSATKPPSAVRCSMHKTRASGLMMAAAMDHDVDVPGRVEVEHRSKRGLGTHHRHLWAAARPAAAHRQVPGLRVVEPALAPRAAGPGRRGDRRGAVHRLAGPARRAARIPRRVLGQRRRRGRRRPRLPAGGAVRAFSRAAGQRARRTPGDPGKGPHRHRLRRPCLLGHRGFRASAC